MYRKPYQPKQRFQRNARKIKTLDPKLLVQKATMEHVIQETPVIKNAFADFLINEQLLKNIYAKGYTTPSPIQDEVIPVVLAGKDVVGIANTGTGKTAAFLIPLINKIIYNRSQKVLILAPTRELAVQIQDELKEFTKNLNIFSVLCIGGVGIHQQVQGIRRNPNVIIGTPGRIKDLKNQGKLQIATFQNIVLDEVDRMLDMGFINDMKYILSHLPSQKQALFFSATISPQISSIIRSFSNDPLTISVKVQETASNVDQNIIKTNGRLKLDILAELLRQEDMKKVIIFGRTKWGIEKLSKQLMQKGLKVEALHGNKNQNQRQRALDSFKNDHVKILLATDIVGRGIDIDDITHVINFDLPESYDDYVHRIGRTGRNNKKGTALTFVD